jgi:tetratricopeptide (TPR) repeat protein
VFICYKEVTDGGSRTKDSVLAQDVHHHLTQAGYKVFFARVTLEDKLGTAYEPYIFSALNSARVMLVVGTRAEHFSAVWVKNEWSRYLALMKKDRGRLLIPCYRDMDPYDLPEELSFLQSQDMSKIGFMQDLLRGVEKVLRAEKPESEVAAASVVAPGVASLYKRGTLFLENGDWKQADEYFDRALDVAPEYAPAYAGKLCAELKIHTEQDLSNHMIPISETSNYKKALYFADAAYRARLEEYDRCSKDERQKKLSFLESMRKERSPFGIAAGNRHTVGLCADGTVVAAGNGTNGQCEVSDWKDIVAIASGRLHTVGLRADGTVVAVGSNKYSRSKVSDWRDIIAVSAGEDHTVGLRADGTVVAVGYNKDRQCDVSGWRDIGINFDKVRERQKRAKNWEAQGLCRYCGGRLVRGGLLSLFGKKCESCARAN